MNVAAVQFKATKGDKAGSLARLVALAREAAAGSHLVVLPEMAATGYFFDGPSAIAPAAEIARGLTFDALAPVAREAHAWIVCGFPERARDRYFNSALVIDPSGVLKAVYRKTRLYEADMTWASPGDSGYVHVQTDTGSFTVGICMDINDDSFTRWCGSASADAIAFPTNWIDEGQNVWPYWAWRLRGVRSALLAANTYGRDGAVSFVGRSAIVHGGRVLASAPAEGDRVLRTTIAGAAHLNQRNAQKNT